MTKPSYEDLYEALKDLNFPTPCGFRLTTYYNKRGEARAYVELLPGIIDSLETIADMIESISPKYSVCIIRNGKVYLNLNHLKYKMKYEVGRSDTH